MSSSTTGYRTTLLTIVDDLPRHLSPATVQRVAEESNAEATGFFCTHPIAYVIVLKWLVFRRLADTWNHDKTTTFFEWCKANQATDLVRLDSVDMSDESQMHAAGHVVGMLVEAFERPPPVAETSTRKLRPRRTGAVTTV